MGVLWESIKHHYHYNHDSFSLGGGEIFGCDFSAFVYKDSSIQDVTLGLPFQPNYLRIMFDEGIREVAGHPNFPHKKLLKDPCLHILE